MERSNVIENIYDEHMITTSKSLHLADIVVIFLYFSRGILWHKMISLFIEEKMRITKLR